MFIASVISTAGRNPEVAEEEMFFLAGALATKFRIQDRLRVTMSGCGSFMFAGFKLQVLIMYRGRSKIQEFADDSNFDVHFPDNCSLIIVPCFSHFDRREKFLQINPKYFNSDKNEIRKQIFISMDSTARMKKDLISKFEKTEDADLLLALQNFISSSGESSFPLNSEQLDSIEKGRREIAEGNWSTNEEVLTELKQWLKK